MADSQIPITAGVGTNVDTRTNTGGDHRQVVVLGDPSVIDSVAVVKATDPASNDEGIVVRDVNTSAIVGVLNSGVTVSGTLSGITNTVAVYFDRGSPAVTVYDGANKASIDNAGADGESNTSSRLNVRSHLSGFDGTNWDRVRLGPGISNSAVRVVQATDSVGSVVINSGTITGITDTISIQAKDGTIAVYFSPNTPSVKLMPITATGSLVNTNDATTITLNGKSNTTWQLAGTWTGVVSFEASNDNSNWVAIWAFQAGASTFLQGTSVNGIYRNTTAGFAYVRVRFSTASSGTVTVTGVASDGTSGVFQNFPEYGPQYIGKQEDVASASGDAGAPAMAIQKASPTDLADTDGDYAMIQMSAGRVWASSTITGSVAVHIGSTGGTLQVQNLTSGTVAISAKDGTMAVYFSQSSPAVNVQKFNGNDVVTPNAGIPAVNVYSTANIFTVSGSVSGSYPSGKTIISPSANASFKVFAYSFTTTAQAHMVVTVENGAASSPTEFWRVALQAPAAGIAGANLSVQPPGYLFATGTSVTLAIKRDADSLLHYSISYIKESA